MPTLLTDELVADTLRSLPGWEGGTEKIWRDVELSEEQAVELQRQVTVDTDAMDHHAVVEQVQGGLRFVLWTHDAGGVTELDISLASHLSDLVHRLTGAPGVNAVRAGEAVVITRNSEVEGIGEPATVGVSSGTGDTPRVPLPDDRPFGVEPGVNAEQR